ncbi:hypothetical protein LGM63_26165 [Burkholderia cepacia]|uniref:hypothetical protein n=1 Tax=Burkholderia cepacia TaxID=292 RepID=UPI001CF2AABF|nr:hypothetical protein [Burkholderia cepacia]MCA7994143.1 hypothetical protein [Burkholderia cepacia]
MAKSESGYDTQLSGSRRCRAERAKRAASGARVRPKRFDALCGSGEAERGPSNMLPAKPFAEFHRLERRLYESISPARQGYSTFHYKILPMSPRIVPYNFAS